MSTIKSSDEHLTLNADGSSKDIKFQANGVEKASISSSGAFTSTTIDATALTGNLPAISGASLTALNATNLGTGTVPTARLGTGTASSSTFLRGDGSWAAATPTTICGVIHKTSDTTDMTNNTTITMNGSDELNGMTFDNGNDALVVGTAGIYAVAYMANGTCTTAASGDGVNIELRKEGSVVHHSQIQPYSTLGSEAGQEWFMSNTLIVTCAVNDKLTLYLTGMSATDGELFAAQISAWKI